MKMPVWSKKKKGCEFQHYKYMISNFFPFQIKAQSLNTIATIYCVNTNRFILYLVRYYHNNSDKYIFKACPPEYRSGGGYSHQNRTGMCLPDFENLTFSLPIFAQFPTNPYTISERKAPNFDKLGAFYNNLPKIHPVYVIWAPSSLMKTLWSLYQISWKSAPKGRHIYVYHVNVRTPRLRCRCTVTGIHATRMKFKS